MKQLTKREQEVLAYIAEGYTNDVISVLLNLSKRTVEKHIGTLYEKVVGPIKPNYFNARVLAAKCYWEKLDED